MKNKILKFISLLKLATKDKVNVILFSFFSIISLVNFFTPVPELGGFLMTYIFVLVLLLTDYKQKYNNLKNL